MLKKTIILLPALAAFTVVGAAGVQYRYEAGRVVDVPVEDAGEASGMVVQELRAMFSEVPPAISQFDTISEKNLFSPERAAWAPPPPPPVVEEEETDEAPPPSGPHRIRLYGTTIGSERKVALLYFERFSSNRKHRMVGEGETVRDDGDGPRGGEFLVKQVEPERVVLADASGQEIVVGLYDHERSAPPPPPEPPTKPAQQPQAPPQMPATPLTMPAPPPPSGDVIRRMEDMPETLEEREQAAKEGRLRRISTPFGPVFRPLE